MVTDKRLSEGTGSKTSDSGVQESRQEVRNTIGTRSIEPALSDLSRKTIPDQTIAGHGETNKGGGGIWKTGMRVQIYDRTGVLLRYEEEEKCWQVIYHPIHK